MSKRKKTTCYALLGVLVVAGVAAFLLTLNGPVDLSAAQDAALSDSGRFVVGAERGEERAGFSGLPKVMVFADPTAPDWPALQDCLVDAAIEAELASFTPVEHAHAFCVCRAHGK